MTLWPNPMLCKNNNKLLKQYYTWELFASVNISAVKNSATKYQNRIWIYFESIENAQTMLNTLTGYHTFKLTFENE